MSALVDSRVGARSDLLSIAIPGPRDTRDDGDVTLVSNLGARTSSSAMTVASSNVSQAFRTGDSEQGYVLETVQLDIATQDEGFTVTAAIHAENDGRAGATLYTLTPPNDLSGDVDVFVAPENAALSANTTYWLVISRNSTEGSDEVRTSTSDDLDPTTMPGLTLPPVSEQSVARNAGSNTRNAKGSQPARTVRMNMVGRHVGDVRSNINTQATVTLGVDRIRHIGHIGFQYDQDWYRISLEANTWYTVHIHDPVITLGIRGVRDSSNAVQSVKYTQGSGSEIWNHTGTPFWRAYFRTSSAGNYFIMLGAYAYGYGEYGFSVNLPDPETTDTSTAASITGEQQRSTTDVSRSPSTGTMTTPKTGTATG